MVKRKSKLNKITQEDRAATVTAILTEVYLPFGTIEQNVIWYIKQQGKNINYGDLVSMQPWLNTFEQFKEAIDNL